jgi:serine/threonine protein kinase
MTTATDSISIQAAKEHPLPQFTPGQQIAGVYEVIEKFDEGMLGAVYKVKHRKSGEVVALKMLRPQLLVQGMTVDRFNHELQLLRQARHPGLVALLDSGEHDGVMFFTMEFIDGKSLRQIINEYRAKGADMPRREMLDILTGLLKVLDEIHPANLHRNLKPENILVRTRKGPDGKPIREVILTDQAISKVVSLAESSLDREGAWYLAPEMSEFRDKATPSSDLYSVGAIFYEMLTGSAPVGRYELPSEILEHEVSEMVDDLVEIALAPNPQDRFQTAEDMLAAVLETFSDLYGSSQTTAKRVLILMAALAVLVSVWVVQYKATQKSPEELEAEEMERRALVLQDVSTKQDTSAPPAPSDARYQDMVWIPGGPYVAGRWRAYDDGGLAGERIEIEPSVDVKGFWIDKYELHAGKKLPPVVEVPEGEEQPPVPQEVLDEIAAWNDQWAFSVDNDRTWTDARGLCEQLDKRLCTEDEWEKACKGPDNWSYTYGDKYIDGTCPDSGYIPKYKAKAHPACKSGYGVHNMGGGVAEWTSSKYLDNYIVKPGPVGGDEQSTRCAGRFDRSASFAQIHVGIRCCAD